MPLSRTGASLQQMFGKINKKIQNILEIDMDVSNLFKIET